MAEVLHVHGDPGRFRSKLRARIARAEEIEARISSHEERFGEREPFTGRRGSLAEAFHDGLWSAERSDLVARIHQWDATNMKSIEQSLGTGSAVSYRVASVPDLRADDAASAMREYLAVRTQELQDIERRIPRRRPTSVRAVDGCSLDDLRASGLFDFEVLNDFESRLSDIENKRKWRGSISAAKELVEAVHRAVFDCLGQPAPPNSTEFVKLGKLARKAMVDELRQQGLGDVASVDGSQQLDRALAGLLQALTEVRNQHGGGHGRHRRNPGLQLRHVQLAVETSVVYSRHVIATLNDLGRLP